MRHTTCFDTIPPFIYHICTALKQILCILCHITSYTTPQPLSISINRHQPISFRYSFAINIVNMRHTTCFDTIQPLIYQPHIYHLCTAVKPLLCILCDITSYTPPQPLSISITLHQPIAFRYSVKIKIVTTCFDTPQPLIYHLCTAL